MSNMVTFTSFFPQAMKYVANENVLNSFLDVLALLGMAIQLADSIKIVRECRDFSGIEHNLEFNYISK